MVEGVGVLLNPHYWSWPLEVLMGNGELALVAGEGAREIATRPMERSRHAFYPL